MNKYLINFKQISFLVVAWLVGVLVARAQVPSRWEKEIAAFEVANKATAGEKVILFTGSSSIRRWENLPSYFPDKKVLNRGFGGSHTTDAIQYLDRIVGLHKLKQILIYEGDNDIASGKTPDRVVRDLENLITLVKEKYPKATVAYLTIKPSPARWKYLSQIQEVNTRLQQYMATVKKGQYIDVFTPMLGSNGKARPEYFVADSVHMTHAGYQAWQKAINPYLK